MKSPKFYEHLAVQYRDQIPDRIRRYLNGRGLPDTLLWFNQIGWNGKRITIPLRDRMSRIRFFRLAKDPEDSSDAPKMLTPPGEDVELYGWQMINSKTEGLVICEGEFDRLVLERYGVPAVTSTGGAGTFKEEWAEVLSRIPKIWICFDQDQAGKRGAQRIARMIPQARIIELPEEVGKGGDITDYFIRLKKTRAEFNQLLKNAKELKQDSPPKRAVPRAKRSGTTGDVTWLKHRVRIEDVIGAHLQLTPKGRYQQAHCPFHEDRTPSFVVYPNNQRFHCYGCGAKGDVIDFLMRKEELRFGEALERLKQST